MVEKKETPKKETKPKKKSVADLTACVNSDKLRRAKLAVYGGSKPNVNAVHLAAKLGVDYEGDALVMEVYKGLLGLVDPERAAKNRENEKIAAEKRARR